MAGELFGRQPIEYLADAFEAAGWPSDARELRSLGARPGTDDHVALAAIDDALSRPSPDLLRQAVEALESAEKFIKHHEDCEHWQDDLCTCGADDAYTRADETLVALTVAQKEDTDVAADR